MYRKLSMMLTILVSIIGLCGLVVFIYVRHNTRYVGTSNQTSELLAVAPTPDTQLASRDLHNKTFGNFFSEVSAHTIPILPERAIFDEAIGFFNCPELKKCMYAAIDKSHALPADFKPELFASGLPGGQLIAPIMYQPLHELFTAARIEGIRAEIISGYRSYETQNRTLESWMQTIARTQPNLSYEERFTEANRIAALPGHSEHQLGTTVDLNTIGARPLRTQGNEKLYDFLERRAHEFGFVITYPENKEDLTGYIYEPWHIRYIGKDVAAVYHESRLKQRINHSVEFFREYGLSD